MADAALPGRVERGGWYTFGLMLALTLFAFVDRNVMNLVAAAMARDLALSDAQLGMVLGLAFATFTIVAVYPIAWAADRFDRRIVLALCVVTWSAGTLACAFVTDFAHLFAAAVAIAAGEAGLAPIALSVIPDLFSGRRRVQANALNHAFSYIGISAGLAVGGAAVMQLERWHALLPAVLQGFAPWRLAFILVSLPAPLFLIAIAFATLRRPERGDAAPQDAAAPSLLAYLARHPAAIGLILAASATYTFAFGCYFAWLPTATARLFGTTAIENGVGLGIANTGGMLAGVAIALVAMRRLMVLIGDAAAIRLAWIAGLLGVPVLAAFPFITAAWQGYALLGALLIAGSAIGAVLPTILQDLAPPALRARMIALYTILAALIAGNAPTVVGLLSAQLGGAPRTLLHAMTLAAVPAWLIAMLCFRLAERHFPIIPAR